jgi:two-component system, NarL family, nitrate/nitrite response regulator NarL
VGVGRFDDGDAVSEPPAAPIRIFLVSPIRIYREGLAHVLATYEGLDLTGSAETVEPAVPLVRRCEVDVVLYDLRTPSGLAGLRRLATASRVRVVALGIEENVEWVIACAEAGISGYVTDDTSLAELVTRVEDAARGEFNCPPHIAASLLRRLATIGPHPDPSSGGRLTSRELEVAELLQEGLSNKQIAHRLTIQLATVKNHVHSILEKLEAPNRVDAVAVLRRSYADVTITRRQPSHR